MVFVSPGFLAIDADYYCFWVGSSSALGVCSAPLGNRQWCSGGGHFVTLVGGFVSKYSLTNAFSDNKLYLDLNSLRKYTSSPIVKQRRIICEVRELSHQSRMEPLKY